MKVRRHPANPLIRPADVLPSRPDFSVVCVFNCGVIRHEGEVLLLMRVAEKPAGGDADAVLVPVYDEGSGRIEVKRFDRSAPALDLSDSRFVSTRTAQYLTSISHFRVARSRDGIHFSIDERPAMSPASIVERFGIEDPRITRIGDRYYINYSAISDATGVTTNLASTSDFVTFQRHGVIFTPDNKDIAIFPERIGGLYYALNRPASAEFKTRDMWISQSPDLVSWGNHRRLMATRPGSWDNGRIGCSAVPHRVEGGWLEIYHGASASDRYCLGAVLLDGREPWKVVARSREPLLVPETDYELHGFYGNVVFCCDALFEGDDVKIYYGAADTCIAYAEVDLRYVLDSLS